MHVLDAALAAWLDAPEGSVERQRFYEEYQRAMQAALSALVASAPKSPTRDWPGGWLAIDDGRLVAPHHGGAWRTPEEATRYGHGRVIWSAFGPAADSSLTVPLTAQYWAGRDGEDPVGVAEIATRLGVQRATVDQWGYRALLPPPDWTVGGRPAWRWATIDAWARSTGRAQ